MRRFPNQKTQLKIKVVFWLRAFPSAWLSRKISHQNNYAKSGQKRRREGRARRRYAFLSHPLCGTLAPSRVLVFQAATLARPELNGRAFKCAVCRAPPNKTSFRFGWPLEATSEKVKLSRTALWQFLHNQGTEKNKLKLTPRLLG